MGKKLRDKLDQMRPKFISGGQKNGHDPKVLEKIWADWEKFASYAFNKSHATCYSWVAYQTAYLKANYPAEYMAATMSRNISNITEITKLMDESKATGIKTLGPDVNESLLKFSVNRKGDIRFGLGAIKGVGESAVQSILDERKKNGEYKNIFDFVQRVNLSSCNRKNIENLALAGAFDSFEGIKREDFFMPNAKGETFTEVLVRYGNKFQLDKAAAATSLFGGDNMVEVATPEIISAPGWSDLDRLNKERDLVGIYLSAHPLDEYRIILENVCNVRMLELTDLTPLQNRDLVMGGIVTGFREGYTKTGKPYGIAKVEDLQKEAIRFVSAKSQCKILSYLIDNNLLTENELDIVKRGRNYKRTSHPKNTDIVTYKMSSGFEAMIGYLYLNDNIERLNEIINYILGGNYEKENN
jgi:DNA polymerase-3 subunit alpha